MPRSRRSQAAPSSRTSRIDPSTSVRRNVTVPVGSDRPCVDRRLLAHCRLIRSASVWSMAIAASGRSRRIVVRPSPPITSVRTSPSATTEATLGRSQEHRELAEMVALLVGPDLPGRTVGLVPFDADETFEDHEQLVADLTLRDDRSCRTRRPARSATAATRCRSSGSSRSNSGTRRSSSIRSISPRLVSVPAMVPPSPALLAARVRIHGSSSCRRASSTSPSGPPTVEIGSSSTSLAMDRPSRRSPDQIERLDRLRTHVRHRSIEGSGG